MNRNIEKIIAYLEGHRRDGGLCKVGRARLRWWKRNGKKFRTVKAALSTWTSTEIEAWFEFAGFHIDRSGRTKQARNTYWAVDDISDFLAATNFLPKHLKARRLHKQVRKWLEVEGKKNLLNRPEHQLLGCAAFARPRSRK